MRKKTLTRRNTADLSLAGAGSSSPSYLAGGSWGLLWNPMRLSSDVRHTASGAIPSWMVDRVRAWDVVPCWASTHDQRFGRGCVWDTCGCLRGTVSSPDGSHEGGATICRECGDTRSQTLVTDGSWSTDRDKSSGHSFALHCIHKVRRTNVRVKDVEVHWLQR